MSGVLEKFADGEYLKFNGKLTKSNRKMLGVRISDIRRVAKEIIKRGEAEKITTTPPFWHEDVLLLGFVLAQSENVLLGFEKYLPYIDNWQTCDLLLNFKRIGKRRAEFLERFQGLKSGSEFERRALVVILLGFFIDDEYIDRAVGIALSADCEAYYASMGVAWFFATAMIKYPNKVLEVLNSGRLSAVTAKRVVRKALESYRIPDELKAKLRTLTFGG